MRTKLIKLETNDEVRTTQIAADTCHCQGKQKARVEVGKCGYTTQANA